MKYVQKMHSQASAVAITFVICLCPAFATASEPSFDCANAQGQVQDLVCTDEALAQLDRTLSTVYHTALENLPPEEVPVVEAEQRGWIKGRDDCWKASDVARCTTMEYRTRIVQLQIVSGQISAPTTVGLTCDDSGGTPSSAAFYNDTSPAAVVLARGQHQVIAFIARSGSGARYTTRGVEFWEHQGQASLDWFGTKLQCTVDN